MLQCNTYHLLAYYIYNAVLIIYVFIEARQDMWPTLSLSLQQPKHSSNNSQVAYTMASFIPKGTVKIIA